MSYENKKKILNYAVVNLLGNIITEKSMVKEFIDYYEVENLVQELIKQYENIVAIGIGIPGVVNRKNKIDFCDIEELNNCDLVERLKERFGKPIVIENDMNSIAYGFYQIQEYEEVTSIAVVAFLKDNWPGSGIIVDGHIVRGNTNFAGEVSYLPFGCTHEEEKEFLKDREESIKIIAKTICSLAAIINPETIVMTGTILTEEILDEICKLVREVIPTKHIPQISFETNVNKYYLSGLSSMTLEYLNSKG
jgi:predicted NBD/HSP70 family sugar kinase